MKERTETNTFQKAFRAFFLILFAALTSCGKKSSSDASLPLFHLPTIPHLMPLPKKFGKS